MNQPKTLFTLQPFASHPSALFMILKLAKAFRSSHNEATLPAVKITSRPPFLSAAQPEITESSGPSPPREILSNCWSQNLQTELAK